MRILTNDGRVLLTYDPEGVGGGTDLGELLPGDVDLASVHELDNVGHGLSLQLQPKVFQSEDDWGLDVRFAKLLLEESATGSHVHSVNIDVMIPADDVQVHEAGLCPQLLKLLTEDPGVVLDQEAHLLWGPRPSHG